MHFISLVGTQVGAILNPLSSIGKGPGVVKSVELLATSHALPRAESIKSFLEAHKKFSGRPVKVTPISSSLATDSLGRPPAQEAVAAAVAQNGRACLNVSGGMNFQIAAILKSVDPAQISLAYSAPEAVYTAAVDGQGEVDFQRQPLPKALDILKLQGVPHSIRRDAPESSFLNRAFLSGRLPRPENAVRNIEIGRVVFDLVWNCGNELRFLAAIFKPHNNGGGPGAGRTAADYLHLTRQVLALALNREEFGELYHREVGVLTTLPTIKDRIESEGRSKVRVFFSGNSKSEIAECYRSLDEFLRPPQDRPVLFALYKEETAAGDPKEIGRDGLMLALGRDISATLAAVWTHRPKKLRLLYTPADPHVRSLKETLLTHCGRLPAEEVSFYPIRMTSRDILEVPPLADCRPCVNITPGTKWHGAMLALWARKHGAGVFSVDAAAGKLSEIGGGASAPLKFPPLADFLCLSGIRLQGWRKDRGAVLALKPRFAGIRRFLALAARRGESVADFPIREMDLGEAIFKRECKMAEIQFFDPSLTVRWNVKNGYWFEDFVAFCALDAGADDVLATVRTSWTPENEKYLAAKYPDGERPHQTDVDVLAGFGGRLYAISCKATGLPRNLEQELTGIKASARLFGRFAIPLLCCLRHAEPPSVHMGVPFFGYKTLIEAEALRVFLERVAADRQKSREATLP
jgi:hypothetical protein